MKKLSNVIKGHCSYENVNGITIINMDEMKVEFCGSIKAFMNPPDFMHDHQKKLMGMDVIKSAVNGTRLDCFIR